MAFGEFFTRDLMDHILYQSNIYSAQRGFGYTLEKEEFLTCIGFLFFTGYHRLPQRRLYWENEDDVKVSFITNNLQRDTFDKFMKIMHLADNMAIDEDKYYKVRPLFDICNRNFKKFPLSTVLCIDEHIVKYYGRHGTKKFIRGKPIRFGYELFGLAAPDAFLHHVEPSCGSSSQIEDYGLGQGPNVVLTLVQKANVPKGSDLFFDNRFTTLPLLLALKDEVIGGTGTMRKTYLHGIPLQDSKSYSKAPRGTFEIVSTNGVEIVRWKDSAVVTIASNCHHAEPLTQVERWSSTEKKRVKIDCPHPVSLYNSCMGGCDLHDQYHYTYESAVRSKKWWWPLASWLLKACFINGFIVYKKSFPVNKRPSFLSYSRSVVQYLVVRYGRPPQPGRPLLAARKNHDLRTDGINHWPGSGEQIYILV